jgi:phospholipase/lecithinase/hemolysin
VGYYLNLHGGHADPNALYIIQGGINDALAATPASAEQLGENIAAGLAALESQLRAAGAAHFLVVNLPDVGLMPAASSNAAAASLASSAANIALKLWVANEQLTQDIEIASLDLYTFSGELKANPAHYGFTNDATPCLSAGSEVCADPSQTFYWDGSNPTAAAHAVLGQKAQAQLVH